MGTIFLARLEEGLPAVAGTNRLPGQAGYRTSYFERSVLPGNLRGCNMVWTYCSACGLRTEWATVCSRCGSTNPLYRLSAPDQIRAATKSAGLPATEESACRAPMQQDTESGVLLQLFGYLAGVLLVFAISLAVILVPPLVLW